MKKIIFLLCIFTSCVSDNPYEEGMHWDYSIHCEEGFLYKTMTQDRGTIPLLNSDGTRVKCGTKRY